MAMVRRRVWSGDGPDATIVWEGDVPSSVENTSTAILSWVQSQREVELARERERAQQQLLQAQLEAENRNATAESVAALATLQQTVEQQGTELAELRARTPASTDELLRWTQQAGRVALAHGELAAVADSAVAAAEGAAAAAQTRLDALDAQQAAMGQQVENWLLGAEGRLDVALAGQETRVGDFLAEQLRLLRAEVAGMVGPQGRQGDPAPGTALVTTDPRQVEPSSWARQWLGRDGLVEGDGCLLLGRDSLLPLRYVGGQWREGGRVEPRVEVQRPRINQLDTGDKLIVSGGANPNDAPAGALELLNDEITAAGGQVPIFEAFAQDTQGRALGEVRGFTVCLLIESGTDTLRITSTITRDPSGGITHSDYDYIGTGVGEQWAPDFTIRGTAGPPPGGNSPGLELGLSIADLAGATAPLALSGWALPLRRKKP